MGKVKYTQNIPHKSGIYSLTNTKDGKRYIGFSVDIKRRMQEHIPCLNNDTHVNNKLQQAWNIDKDYFILEVIELTDDTTKENYWTLFYKSHIEGYNFDIGHSRGEDVKRRIRESSKLVSRPWLNRSRTIEERHQISETLRGRPCPEIRRKKISLTTKKNYILKKIQKLKDLNETIPQSYYASLQQIETEYNSLL